MKCCFSGNATAAADFDRTFSADGKQTAVIGIGAAEIQKTVGQAGGKIVAGDLGRDGRSEISIFCPSNGVWYILKSSDTAVKTSASGENSDIPVASTIIR